MQRDTIYPDGTPVPRSHCILPDHYQTTFAVIGNISKEQIDRIQTKFEITMMKLGYFTVRSLSPHIVNQVLDLLDLEDSHAIEQRTIVQRR